MEPTTSPSMTAPRHPWAIWDLVLSAPRWLLHRGYPPELDAPRLSVRLVRISIVTFLLGMLAAWAYVGLKLLAGYSGLRHYLPEFIYILIYCCYPGLCFGLIVLVPLSRWQGRNWWWTAAAVPVSAIVHHLLFSFQIPWVAKQPSWVYRVTAGTIGGFGVAFWMVPPVNRRALAFIPLTAMAGVVGYFATYNLLIQPIGDFFHSRGGSLEYWYYNSLLIASLQDANLFWPFNSLVAMVLGWELATNPRYRR
jgi:hypothetical protein